MNVHQWEKVKELFYSALEVPEDEREEFVQSRCGDDATLLVEVKSLFEAHEHSEAFIESPALQSISTFVDDSANPPRVGQVIGAYKIETQLGRGGMGAVYLATRADDEFQKKVAIKLIKRGFDTDEIVERFRRERQILAGLEHPYITRLLDGGSTSDGLPYLVMDYVAGEPLIDYSDRQRLTIRERLELFLKICLAVTYAHQSLVIHRDLKPSNVLVTADGTPKLLDFGIAKLTDVSDGSRTSFETVDALRAMTPDYASPEQISGYPVTTATDIYSLGVVLYQLLTGHKPYNFKSRNVGEIQRVLNDNTPLKPSVICQVHGLKVDAADPQAWIRELRGDLDKIVFMAIRNESDRRYLSVEQFANDVQRYLDGLPVIAQDDTFGYRASKFVVRNKAGVAAGLGITASLIGGLFAATRQARKAERQRDRAQHEALKAEKVNRFLQKMLASADPRSGGKDVRVAEILETAARAIDTDFAAQPDIAADLNTTIGLTYLGLGRIETAGKHLLAAREWRLQHSPHGSVALAMSHHAYGKFLLAKGDLNAAEPCYLEALETFRREDPKSLDVADVLADLGYLTALKGDLERSNDLHQEELVIKILLLGPDHPEVGRATSRVASVLSLMGNHKEAELYHWKALEILQSVHGEDHPDIALAMNELVRSLFHSDPTASERIAREALEMRRRLLDENHPDIAWSLYNLAYLLIERGAWEDSRRLVQEILLRRGADLPDEHPVIASSLLLLGKYYMQTGDFERACHEFNACLELRMKTLPAEHWLIASTKSLVGECHVYMGETEEGKRLLSENYEFLKERLGPGHERTRQAKERIDNAYLFLRGQGRSVVSEKP
jgi:eukaryotic-like serine/threonine-protein kinase